MGPRRPIELTTSSQLITAALRLSQAWGPGHLDIVEMHEAVLELIRVTHTVDLQSALAVLNDVESDGWWPAIN
jgi:hypothetical protein